jgi:hypothetical protein
MRRETTSRRNGRKDFGENLAPLRRFLRRQVGRPWDQVFSEIRKACPPNTATTAHIYQHIFDYIVLNVEMRTTTEGLVPFGSRSGGTPYRLTNILYVSQGIVKWAPKRPRNRRAWNARVVSGRHWRMDKRGAADVYHVRRLLDGKWFEVRVAPGRMQESVAEWMSRKGVDSSDNFLSSQLYMLWRPHALDAHLVLVAPVP